MKGKSGDTTKYGSFGRFTQKIRGIAFPKQEDEWMGWGAATNMMKA